MAKLILKSYPAEKTGAFTSIAITQDGPLASRTVEIQRAADAATALAAYMVDLTATGKPAVACMSLARGERSPPGFKALNAKGFHEVNLS